MYEGDSGQRDLLSMRFNLVSTDVSIEPGDLRRGETTPVNDDDRRSVKFGELPAAVARSHSVLDCYMGFADGLSEVGSSQAAKLK